MIIVKIGGGNDINIPGIIKDLAGLSDRLVTMTDTGKRFLLERYGLEQVEDGVALVRFTSDGVIYYHPQCPDGDFRRRSSPLTNCDLFHLRSLLLASG